MLSPTMARNYQNPYPDIKTNAMKNGTKIIFVVVTLTLAICIGHILNDHGGSALRNILDTITLGSLIVFILSLSLLSFSFKRYAKSIIIWILLLISSPLALTTIINLHRELTVRLSITTTPNEFRYELNVTPNYKQDIDMLQKKVDSLVELKTIAIPSEYTRRYFNGNFYNDNIDRHWAIDISTSNYQSCLIDTLFYDKNGKDIIAGLLITKTTNYNNEIEYNGYGFRYNKTSMKPFEILKYIMTGYDNATSCSQLLRYYYLKKIGSDGEEYNMNDIRFLNRKNDTLLPEQAHIKK
ncbi:hypothetical protein [Fulvivirga ligni]|uniref:hypothetical protein n=1 Tax=Fulvivirga ligni TaxID=2904246 RepID=UPI001F2D0902|nr:hypothetical protein [Fulvivirga ligni]UII21495.1 hypothetical protein LVD16_27075 [Fulvivirga ligni]